MSLHRMFVGVLVAASLSGCGDAAPPTEATSRAPGPPQRPGFNTVSWTTLVDPLRLEVSQTGVSPTMVGVPVNITASMPGARGNVYYYWSMQQCVYYPDQPEIYIHCTAYWPVQEGWNAGVYSFMPDSRDVEYNFHIEAREEPAGYTTAATYHHADGPAIWAYGMAPDYGNPFGWCVRNNTSVYPFEEWSLVDGRYVPTGRQYRRGACDGTREYDPAKPDTITRQN